MKEVTSAERIYEIILERALPPMPGFEAMTKQVAWERANKIHFYLADRADRLESNCMTCEKKRARASRTVGAYDTPWQEQETKKRFCTEECADIYLYEEPWSYFDCEGCGRLISRQNPRNGWQIQYREYGGEEVCLRCYEALILENGVEREKLEDGQIPGMFFSYGNLEPLSAGYQEVDGFKDFFVNTARQAEKFRRKALELMDQGKKVVIGYERLAIGGSEGYVTLMVKDAERPRRRMSEVCSESKS